MRCLRVGIIGRKQPQWENSLRCSEWGNLLLGAGEYTRCGNGVRRMIESRWFRDLRCEATYACLFSPGTQCPGALWLQQGPALGPV